MSLRLFYPDTFLQRMVTIEREDRAFAYVDSLGTFPADHRNEMARIRTYILVCIESQADSDDLFATKLEVYRDEFERALGNARAATPDEIDGLVPAVFSIELERA
jgi:hypothetical protein